MEGKFIEFLEQIAPGFGVTLVVLVVGGGLLIGFVKGFNTLKQRYDSHVLAKKAKEDSDKEFKEAMLKTVTNLQVAFTGLEASMAENKKASDNDIANLTAMVAETNKSVEALTRDMVNMKGTQSLLLKSEMERIRGYIIGEYLKWTELEYIDISAAQNIEEQYKTYLACNGDSFIADLINDLRSLEKRRVIVSKRKMSDDVY